MTRQVVTYFSFVNPLFHSAPPSHTFILFFIFFSLIHGKSSTPLRTLPTLLTIKRLFFQSSVLHRIHFSPPLSLSLKKLGLLLISTIPSLVPLFLTEDLQIPLQDANFNAKHEHLVIFPLSSIANLKKKRLYCKNLSSPSADLRKKKIFTKKSSIADLFQQFCKIGSTFPVSG